IAPLGMEAGMDLAGVEGHTGYQRRHLCDVTGRPVLPCNPNMRVAPMPPVAEDPIARTRQWMERAVIGLNLCPFAKAVAVRDQVRFVLSEATTPEALLEDLARELVYLRDADPGQTDTTLLVHPQVLGDFL